MDASGFSALFAGIATLVSLGALGVAIIALRAQAKDRALANERWKAEKADRTKDQARLVTSSAVGNGGGLSIKVHNGSDAPISRVRVISLMVDDDEDTRWELNGRVWANSAERYQVASKEDVTFHVDLLDSQGTRRLWAGGTAQWVIGFMDANQVKWQRHMDGDPTLAT